MSTFTPKYATITDWQAISGMRRTSTYEALGRGDLRAIKLGARLLIEVQPGLEWLASMPAAAVNISSGKTLHRAAA